MACACVNAWPSRRKVIPIAVYKDIDRSVSMLCQSTVSLCEDNEHSSRWYTCRGLMPKPNVY